jgi:hypothetical protein
LNTIWSIDSNDASQYIFNSLSNRLTNLLSPQIYE